MTSTPLDRIRLAFGLRLLRWGRLLARVADDGPPALGPEPDARQRWLDRVAHLPPSAWEGRAHDPVRALRRQQPAARPAAGPVPRGPAAAATPQPMPIPFPTAPGPAPRAAPERAPAIAPHRVPDREPSEQPAREARAVSPDDEARPSATGPAMRRTEPATATATPSASNAVPPAVPRPEAAVPPRSAVPASPAPRPVTPFRIADAPLAVVAPRRPALDASPMPERQPRPTAPPVDARTAESRAAPLVDAIAPVAARIRPRPASPAPAAAPATAPQSPHPASPAIDAAPSNAPLPIEDAEPNWPALPPLPWTDAPAAARDPWLRHERRARLAAEQRG